MTKNPLWYFINKCFTMWSKNTAKDGQNLKTLLQADTRTLTVYDYSLRHSKKKHLSPLTPTLAMHHPKTKDKTKTTAAYSTPPSSSSSGGRSKSLSPSVSSSVSSSVSPTSTTVEAKGGKAEG